MTGGTRIDRSETDSNLLVSLSRASRALKSCTSEDIKDTLLDLSRLATGPCAEPRDADVSHSKKEDGESSHAEVLVWLLQSRCKAVQYAAVKTLLALSDALRRTRALPWAPFLDQLWTAVMDWVSDPLWACGQCLKAKTLLAATNAVDLLQRILKGCLRNFGSGDFQDLRTFLKLFSENIRVLATSACSKQNLSNCSECLADVQVLETEGIGDPEELFLGSVLRLICTGTNVTASNSPFLVNDNATMTEQFLEVMEAIIPTVSSAVLPHHMNCERSSCISPFLCHKLLMIMMRLSGCFRARHFLALACCSSLDSFGGSLLGFTLLDSSATTADDPLADSPFLSSLAPNSRKAPVTPSVRHLQRRALYILFKIASSVVQCPKQRTGVTSLQDVEDDPQTEQEKSLCTLQQTVSKILIDWLDRQSPPGTATVPFLNDSGSMLGCAFLDQVAVSFVGLYFDEDDLMLQMLILLSGQPPLLSALTTTENSNKSRRWKLVAMALRPERVFHAFLAAIQFNSSVLLDFLISEDSGALCVLYLMKSLRCVLDSWPKLEKSVPGTYFPDEEGNTSIGLITRPVGKRKREGAIIRGHAKDSQGYGLKMDCNSSDRMSISGEDPVLRREAYCLLQLKLSIERLHRRSLFPYNPSALLRRFDAVLKLLEKYLVAGEPTRNS